MYEPSIIYMYDGKEKHNKWSLFLKHFLFCCQFHCQHFVSAAHFSGWLVNVIVLALSHAFIVIVNFFLYFQQFSYPNLIFADSTKNFLAKVSLVKVSKSYEEDLEIHQNFHIFQSVEKFFTWVIPRGLEWGFERLTVQVWQFYRAESLKWVTSLYLQKEKNSPLNRCIKVNFWKFGFCKFLTLGNAKFWIFKVVTVGFGHCFAKAL